MKRFSDLRSRRLTLTSVLMDVIWRRLISAYLSDKSELVLEYSVSVFCEHVVKCVHFNKEVLT